MNFKESPLRIDLIPQLNSEQEKKIFTVLQYGYIYQWSEFDKNLFSGSKNIEVCGTPSIGKTTTIHTAQQIFNEQGYPFSISKEPRPTFSKDIGRSIYNQLIFQETIKNILRRSTHQPTNWIYDRGGLGQIAFNHAYLGDEIDIDERDIFDKYLFYSIGHWIDVLLIVNPEPTNFSFTQPNSLSAEFLEKLHQEYQQLPKILAQLDYQFHKNRNFSHHSSPLTIGYTEDVKNPLEVADLLPKMLGSVLRL